MNKQIALISVITLVLTAIVGVGAYVMLQNSPGNTAKSTGNAEHADTSSAGSQTAPVDDDADAGLDLAGISRPACPSSTVPGAGVELPCLSEQQAVDKHGGPNNHADDTAVTVVNMWAWWCQPCREEIPYLEQVQQQHPEWTIVGVHADQNAKNGAGMLEEMGADFVSYQDSHNKFATELALPGVIPITIVYVGDQQKKVFAQPFHSAQEIIDSIEGVL